MQEGSKRLSRASLWECTLCGKTFRTEGYVDAHMMRAHSAVVPEVRATGGGGGARIHCTPCTGRRGLPRGLLRRARMPRRWGQQQQRRPIQPRRGPRRM